MHKLFPCTVTDNIEIAPGAYILSFKREFDFHPGQVIGLHVNPEGEPRLYSISSGNKQEEVWILYNVKSDGALTPPLSQVKKGQTVFITKPFGSFSCDDQPAVWIATGTGIAPFASMIFSGLVSNKILIQGNRNPQGLYFRETIEPLLGENYKPCCSRASAPGCFSGRVTDFLHTLDLPHTNFPYYLCGSAEMVVDVRDMLIEKGVPYDKIMAEIFF